MTRVCLVGTEDVNLRYELLSRETARDALLTYDLREPFANTVAVETVSLGAAVALLNDLNWYLVRFAADAMVNEPSVSETEWLSRDLATAIRDDAVDPADTGRFLKVYGVRSPDPGGASAGGGAPAASPTDAGPKEDGAGEAAAGKDGQAGGREGVGPATEGTPRLLEPMFVTRTGETIPEYDLHEVEETLRVRVTEAEFGA